MWIAAQRKTDGTLELVNTAHIARIFVNQDDDPETVVVFASGNKVAYAEHPSHFRGS